MRFTILIPAILLAACATSPEGIEREAVWRTYTSAKAPMDIARCLKDLMPGLDVYPGESVVSVSNRNQFNSILMNWRIIPTETGSLIELRRTNAIAPGEALGTRCY